MYLPPPWCLYLGCGWSCNFYKENLNCSVWVIIVFETIKYYVCVCIYTWFTGKGNKIVVEIIINFFNNKYHKQFEIRKICKDIIVNTTKK